MRFAMFNDIPPVWLVVTWSSCPAPGGLAHQCVFLLTRIEAGQDRQRHPAHRQQALDPPPRITWYEIPSARSLCRRFTIPRRA